MIWDSTRWTLKVRDILEENVPSSIKTSNVPEAYCKREVIQTDSSPIKRRLTDFTNETSDKIVDARPDLPKDTDKNDHGFSEFRCEGQQELTFLDGAARIKSPVSFTFSARLAEIRDLRQIKTKLHAESKVKETNILENTCLLNSAHFKGSSWPCPQAQNNTAHPKGYSVFCEAQPTHTREELVSRR